MDSIILGIVLLSAVGSGVMAGVFFIFSNTAMSAFGQLPPAQGISSMQTINRVILNPVFFLFFMGTAAVSALMLVSLIWLWGNPGSVYVLIGATIYIVGSFLVTVVFNVPMNNALDAEDASTDEAAKVWADYLVNWTMWNHVRTVACILSSVFFILGFKYW